MIWQQYQVCRPTQTHTRKYTHLNCLNKLKITTKIYLYLDLMLDLQSK